MHIQANRFLQWASVTFNEYFKENITVLDVGSGDINGNNRLLFPPVCTYWGNDVSIGANVNIVSKTSALPFSNDTFDVVVSSECFEHDPEYVLSLQKIFKMLKPGGLFFFTCASTGRAEHGTLKTIPTDSLATRARVPVWSTYYKNLEKADIEAAWEGITASWAAAEYYYNASSKDIYFWGIKPLEGMEPCKPTAAFSDHLVTRCE